MRQYRLAPPEIAGNVHNEKQTNMHIKRKLLVGISTDSDGDVSGWRTIRRYAAEIRTACRAV